MKVLNAKIVGKNVPGAVYCGRPSRWGNPFIIGKDGTREAVVAKYAEWICDKPELLDALGELHGKDLICWCAPLLCHCSILIELCMMRFCDGIEQ